MSRIRVAAILGCITLFISGPGMAVEPPVETARGRTLPAELLVGDGVITYAIPPDFEPPVTYLDESRIKASTTTIIWPERPILPDGHKLCVQVENPSRLQPMLNALTVLKDDEIIQLVLMDIVLYQDSLNTLKRFKHVRDIGCRISKDQDVAAIVEIWQDLQTIAMNEVTEGAKFTDRGLDHLATLKKLRGLRVNGTRLTGVGFRSLAAISSLEGIAFVGNRTVRGPDISALSRMPHLREVVLHVPNDFADDDLMALAECKGLLHICLFGAEQVSQTAITKLRVALPRCSVHVRREVSNPGNGDLPY